MLCWLAESGYAEVQEVTTAEESMVFSLPRELRTDLMTSIARTHAIDVIRIKIREPRPPDEVTLEAAEPTALGAMEARVEFDAVGRCLRDLEYGERHAIVLAYRDGLSYDQLAVLLGVSVETVKGWVSRGLAKLRDCMDKAP